MILPYDANPKPDGIFGKDTGFLAQCRALAQCGLQLEQRAHGSRMLVPCL